MSLGPIVWLYVAEILPDKGLAFGILFHWIFVTFVCFLFPIFKMKAHDKKNFM